MQIRLRHLSLMLACAAAFAADAPATKAADKPEKAKPATPAVEIPMDDAAFGQTIAKQLNQAVDLPEAKPVGPLKYMLGDVTLDMTKLHDECKTKPETCSKGVERYVKGAGTFYRMRHFKATKDAVRLMIRTPEYVAEARKNRAADAADFEVKPLVGNLEWMPALNAAHAVRALDANDVKVLGISNDEVYKLALVNLTATLKPLDEVAKPVGDKVGRIDGDFFNASRLVLHDSWAKLAEGQNGKLLVAVPGSDVVLYTGDDSAASVKALREAAEKELKTTKFPIATTVLRWTKAGWEVVS